LARLLAELGDTAEPPTILRRIERWAQGSRDTDDRKPPREAISRHQAGGGPRYRAGYIATPFGPTLATERPMAFVPDSSSVQH
jgi:hypothetical protein